MKKLDVVKSRTAPLRDSLWIKDNRLKTLGPNGWENIEGESSLPLEGTDNQVLIKKGITSEWSDIKTINGQSLIGNGNIIVEENKLITLDNNSNGIIIGLEQGIAPGLYSTSINMGASIGEKALAVGGIKYEDIIEQINENSFKCITGTGLKDFPYVIINNKLYTIVSVEDIVEEDIYVLVTTKEILEFESASSYIISNVAEGSNSTAVGFRTYAKGTGSFASGNNTKALGNFSTVAGNNTIATGIGSHAEGIRTIASSNYQHVQGMWNEELLDAADIVGWGTSSKRKNIEVTKNDGTKWLSSDVTCGGSYGTPTHKLSEKLNNPTGGTEGQVLTKTSSGVAWTNPSSGGASVSVSGTTLIIA